ncbi:hypothetical protein DRN86_02770 [Candidatus Geothermarchaeota archaeon]|nr:MAG: hypothetical protein DRN86_02770 [Candidatus Geothermarchaeota archaeon]
MYEVMNMGFEEFEEMIDEFFERFERIIREMRRKMKAFEEYLTEDIEGGALKPLTSVYVSGDKITVTADLPLVEPSSIKVELLNPKILYIEAKIKREIPSTYISCSLPPCTFKYFKARVRLPFPATKISSVKLYRDILEVVLLRE